MEFTANYDLMIQYHPRKDNAVANALSRQKMEADAEKDLESLTDKVKNVILLTLEGEPSEPLGLQAVTQASLFHRIREESARQKLTENR